MRTFCQGFEARAGHYLQLVYDHLKLYHSSQKCEEVWGKGEGEGGLMEK